MMGVVILSWRYESYWKIIRKMHNNDQIVGLMVEYFDILYYTYILIR